MSAEKRPASDAFGSAQLVVKRPNLGNNGKAVAVVNGAGGNGALIQAVCAAFREPYALASMDSWISEASC